MRLAALFVAIVAASPLQAQEGADAEAGRALYAASCATCHGLQGAGDGPMTAILTLPVPDLRRLAADAGGTFPMRRVVASIDGRDPILAHGGAMPVFGLSLSGPETAIVAEDGEDLSAPAEAIALARYLETLQEE